MRVVTTAGHVDHGKSALVRALTGIEPDRFAEERQRGLTIDLGFAWCELPSGARAAFVDVPGHERFIANMLAGVGSVELALLVVAADEGWMPQSREHRDILDVLGVRHAVVAVTKTDLVDAETAELAVELVRDELAGTALADAEIVAVSGSSGAGVGQLRQSLDRMIGATGEPADRGRPRLWVDRAFTIRGAGTVVTGTLAGGALHTGDEVGLRPGRSLGRVRGLQMLGEATAVAPPGARVAANLAGVDLDEVHRGQALVRPAQWAVTDRVDTRLRVTGGAEVSHRGAWRVHVGTAERDAVVLPTAAAPITDDGFARLELDEPVPVTAGDRLVVRETGRWVTVAGGVVLDPEPAGAPRGRAARSRRSAELSARAAALADDDRVTLLGAHLAERGADERERALRACGMDAAEANAAVTSGVVQRAGRLVDPAALARWRDAATTALARAHAEQPHAPAAPRDVVERALAEAGCGESNVEAVMAQLVEEGAVVVAHGGVARPDHRVELRDDDARARDALLAELGADPFNPPRLSQATEQAHARPDLVRSLETTGVLVRLADDLAVPAATVDDAAKRLRALYEQHGAFTAAQAKETLGTTRRLAVPLLEHLDKQGVTRRQGDLRVITA